MKSKALLLAAGMMAAMDMRSDIEFPISNKKRTVKQATLPPKVWNKRKRKLQMQKRSRINNR